MSKYLPSKPVIPIMCEYYSRIDCSYAVKLYTYAMRLLRYPPSFDRLRMTRWTPRNDIDFYSPFATRYSFVHSFASNASLRAISRFR